MKLIFLIPTMRSGGAERVMSILVDYFVLKGYEVHLLIFDEAPSFYALNAQVHCHQIHPLKMGNGLVFTFVQLCASFRIARALIKKIGPNYLIGFTTVINVLTILLGRLEKVPIVISERTNPQLAKESKPTRVLRKIFYRFADAIVLQTENSVNSLKKVGVKIPQNRRVIFNPVREEFTDLGFQRENIILSIGRLSHEKGHDLLLQAWSKVQPKGWKLLIAGDGENREMLMQLALSLNIYGQVEFLGKIKNVNALLNRARIFVLPSRLEGLPNALCEAMVAGCACISFDCANGPAEIIHHGVNGLLVEAENTDEMAEAINELVHDETKQKLLAANAVLLKNKLSEDVIGEKWEKMLKSLVVN